MSGLFFRGEDRTDILFCLMLQTACDWKSNSEIADVAGILGFERLTRYSIPLNAGPPVTVVFTTDYVFVVSSSTHGLLQWVGNVLGSAAVSAPPSAGTVSAYFGAVASAHYQGIRSDVLSGIGSRRLVFIGFSLGGASVTILKDMFYRGDGISSACFAFGSPRAGTTSFAAGYPVADYVGVVAVNDPVPSVPPTTWAGLGGHNAWTPFPPFVTYTQIDPGFTLFLDGNLAAGYFEEDVPQVVQDFADGSVLTFHNQNLYARLIRTLLPDNLTDGYDGYGRAGSIDDIARTVFDPWQPPWSWGSTLKPFIGVSNMVCQASFYIRDKSTPPLGFQEIYYFASDDAAGLYDSGINGPYAWVGLRATFLSKSCEIYGFRVSHVGSPKKSYLKRYEAPIQGQTGVTATIEDCINFTGFSAGNASKRMFHFRGIDANWLKGDTVSGIGQTKLPLIADAGGSFVARLKISGLAILSGFGTSPTLYNITAAAKATQDAPITITTNSTFVFGTGLLIEIRGCREAPLLNGRWKIIGAPAAGQIILSGSARYAAPPVIGGNVKVLGIFTSGLATESFAGVGSKKTGRPSFLQRGRRSAQLRHR